MPDLIQRSLSAKRESKYIEFKQGFDPNSPGEWCELIKDIVAIANSGGGIIIFGLDNTGIPTGNPVDSIAGIDPADITNKISKYTGPVDLEFGIRLLEKDGHSLVAIVLPPVSIPLVFQKPGTYNIGSGKQKTAFSRGTVYFRHGAKSEPGTSGDIRNVIERQLEYVRKSWLKGVRKVVKAPPGSQFVTVAPVGGNKEAASIIATTVRAVNDPSATPVRLTRDPTKSSGSFVHEEVSDGIFDEINNVIDANRVLAKGQPHFFLGQPIYYRIYAERHHVVQSEETVSVLLSCAIMNYYAPFAFWTLLLPDKLVAQTLATLYLNPKNPNIHILMRMAILLGTDFTSWLYEKWHSKWNRYSQPPSFYWTFKQMMSKAEDYDPRAVAARTSITGQISVAGDAPVSVKKLLDQPELSASLLSKACIRVFEGDNASKTAARNLDYFAYGVEIQRRASKIAKAIVEAIGDQYAGDLIEGTESDLKNTKMF
ncbi:MAG: ATP-binding protein [Proteobacteria bacterium]|nr:ATP-binding protein [Pseudomonadota bacterium]MBU4069125.1 ATP-binding protein [Pseudomonadota bacterium]MBU4127819.1 ATP-binding protein [Pseudomonadota bacterium]